MRSLMVKEMKLSASVLSYCFIAFGIMFFLPGYPILCGAFFSCLGIFQSFQNAREANDLVFSALLPVSKKDVVRGKVYFSCMIELATLVVMAIAVLVRMTLLADNDVYRQNALMNANLYALGCACVIFGLFNLIFIGGFFKTSYKLGRPFLTFIIVNFVMILAFEALHYIPGMQAVNSFGFDNIGLQLALFAFGALTFVLFTMASLKKSLVNFENTDL